MNLNINTPKGKKSLVYEKELTSFFERHNEGLKWIDTPKGQPALIDGIWIRDGEIKSCSEIKCRDLTEAKFLNEYKAEWLVSVDKLENGRLAAKLLGVPFFGYLALVRSGVVYYKELYNSEGEPSCEWIEKHTVTPKNINGGKVRRLNAFINMEDAWRINYTTERLIQSY